MTSSLELKRCLAAKFPGREHQISYLVDNFASARRSKPSALYVFGFPSAGKRSVVKAFLEAIEARTAFLNLIECHKPKLVFESALNQISGHKPCKANGYRNAFTCNTFDDFCSNLEGVIDRSNDPSTVYLVLDRAERLQNTPEFSSYLRLRELTRRNVCVILLSRQDWQHFRTDPQPQPPTLVFPPYTDSQVVDILCRDKPDGVSDNFFKDYVEMIWQVFQPACKSLNELRHIVNILYPVYRAPVDRGLSMAKRHVAEHDSRKLWRYIETYTRSMDKFFLREISTAEWSDVLGSSNNAAGEEDALMDMDRREQAFTGLVKGVDNKNQLILPVLSKFLVCSAFFASNNPARTDNKFFGRGKSRGHTRTVAGKVGQGKAGREMRAIPYVEGPKPFGLDRLMAIFYSIVNDSADDTMRIQCTINQLVSLGILSQVSAEDSLDMPKYRCNVTREEARLLARSINFEEMFNHYLYESHA